MRRALLIAGLLLLTAPMAQAEETLEQLVNKLKENTSTNWSPAYMELNRRRDPRVIPLLLESIESMHTTPQMYSVYIISNLDASKAVMSALRKITKMKPVNLRARAMRALYDKGERKLGALGREIVEAARGDASNSILAISALGYIREVPELTKAMREWIAAESAELVFCRLAWWFHLLPDRTDVIPTMVSKRDGEDNPTVRASAAAYLMAYGARQETSKGATVLAEMLATGEVEYSSYIYIEYLIDASATVPKAVLDVVAERVPEETGHYAARLLKLLAKRGFSGIAKLAKGSLESSDKELSKAAFDVLAELPGGFSRETLAKLLASDRDERRVLAAKSLRRADDYSGLPILLEVLKDGEGVTDRRDAAEALGGFRMPAVVEPLLAAMGDQDSLVRTRAFSSLSSVLSSLFPYRRMNMSAAGFQYMDPEHKRNAAIAKIRTWWDRHKDAAW